MEVPHATPPATPIEPHAGRFSSTVRPISAYEPDPDPHGPRPVAILGMPDDTGVTMNGGRPGAKEGPSAIRRALARMGVDQPGRVDWPPVFDAGDVLPVGDDLDETHRRASEAAAALAGAGFLPIGLGGGHDLTYAFVRGVGDGLPRRQRPSAGFYLDAHLDVRETKGSGMPFRRLVEECGVEKLHVSGLDPLANAREHLEWFHDHGGHTDLQPTVPIMSCFASLDLDAIDAAYAPGVSAANPCGCDARFARVWITTMARARHLRCLDIMELSPPHDDHDRTARLAASLLLTALHVLGARAP
jgi:arginase family enzyme